MDAGASTNRTVYTFVGGPDEVVEAALNAAKIAYHLIDMANHSGEHKRLGALDVCPFIPVQAADMQDCIYCARKFGQKLGQTLNVPVYLYGYASVQDHRQTVPQIRSGEYEGLKDKLTLPDWIPDFGPAQFVPNWGASIVGARKFLIAYNVNLISTKEQAHRIALNIREQGRGDGQEGRLKCLQAMGWWLSEYSLAQVTANLLDFNTTAIHTVYEEVCKDARQLNLPVVGSQIIGLVPLKAMLVAANYYMEKENLFILEEDQKIRLVIDRLGLSSLGPFNPKERIIEYMIEEMSPQGGRLIDLPLNKFIYSVGDRTTAPGGGSVAAVVGALGCALASMVGKMSYGRKAFEGNDGQMRQLIPIFHHEMNKLAQFIDADTNAYKDYVSALKLPKGTTEEQIVREAAIEVGIKNAIEVPLNLARTLSHLWTPCTQLASLINISSASDLEVGANCIHLGILGAHFNVLTNLNDTKDIKFKEVTSSEIDKIKVQSELNCHQILRVLDERKTFKS